jgi:hypothetical protein
MKLTKLAAFALAVAATFAIGNAQAAVITFQTGQSFAGTQATAEGYRTAVEAAVAGSSLGTKVLTSYDIVSNQSLFGTGSSNLAYKSDIVFGLDAAGTYSFRAGVDFGKGGALFLDGVAVDVKSNDMWWAHNYANTDSIFQVSNQSLLAGNHTLTLFGLEGCCDGGQQVQFSANGAAFQSFSAQTLAPVPEPETYAMMLGGIGMIGVVARRRRQRQA